VKSIVGFAFFLLFLAGFAFVMLQGKQMVKQNMAGGGTALTATHWRPVSVDDQTIPVDSGLFVTFEVDGSIRGHGGCNSFSGSLELSDDGLSTGPLAATRMACPEAIMDREMAFMNALQSMADFAIDDNGLRLLDGEAHVVAKFVAVAQN
jgi:heat shock protein HslJ